MQEKEEIDSLKSFKQKLYKVGFGPNLWSIISEDSLDKYTYLEGAIEYYGERILYYIPEEDLTADHDYNY